MKLILILLSTGLFACSADDINCSDFRTGKFRYLRAHAPDTRVARTAKEQIESSEEYQYEDTYSVTWTDACKYTLVNTATTNDSLMFLEKTDTIFVEIIETTDTSYKYKSRLGNHLNEGELIRIYE